MILCEEVEAFEEHLVHPLMHTPLGRQTNQESFQGWRLILFVAVMFDGCRVVFPGPQLQLVRILHPD